MALEIERRFLVAAATEATPQPWQAHVSWQARLRQGYLSAGAGGFTTRVRSDGGGAAWLTLKCDAAGSDGLVRHEFEYPIPAADADELLTLCPSVLSKRRYGLDLPGGNWVLDVFEDANAPLVIAEVELADAADAAAMVVPPWCISEITGQGQYSNAALASSPLAAWPPAERQALLAMIGG